MNIKSILFMLLVFIACDDDTNPTPVLGCTDSSKCNYNELATEDDGSCLENDCAGICGGSTIENECGICGGVEVTTDCSCDDMQSFVDGQCDCNGFILDECGVCGGNGIPYDACDCEGNILDECGVCAGSGIPDGACDCYGTELDDCGVCGGNGPDCEGVCGGGALLDMCGICNGSGNTCLAPSLVGTWDISDQSQDLYITTNQDVSLLNNATPGTGAITVSGSINTNLNILTYYEYSGIISITSNGCYEYGSENCTYINFYPSSGGIYFNHQTNDVSYYMSNNEYDEIEQLYEFDNFTLTITENIILSTYDEYTQDTITINISGSLTASTTDLVSGQPILMSTNNYYNDYYDDYPNNQQLFVVFNSDGSFNSYQEENCHLNTNEYWCSDNSDCSWNEDSEICEEFICSDQTEIYDCWDGPCDWDDELETCLSMDDDDGPSSWSVDGNQLTVYESSSYDNYINSMTLIIGLDNNNNITLSMEQDACSGYYGYDGYGYSYENCFDNFAMQYYGLEGNQIDSIFLKFIITLQPINSRNISLNRNHNLFIKQRSEISRIIK